MKLANYNQYFKLYESCILVKGIKRSIICDTQKRRYLIIPNLLYEILLKSQNKNIILMDLIKEYLDEKKGLLKYLSYFIANDYGFFTTIPKNFPKIKLEWDYPAKFTNCILDFDNNSTYLEVDIINNLVGFGCLDFELRFFQPISFQKISESISIVDSNKDIKNIEILMPFCDKIEYLYKKYNKITRLLVFDAPEDKSVYNKISDCAIIFSKKKKLSEKSCGIIDKKFFTAGLRNVTEAIKFNSCLNRKISIDRNGYYKNCPSQEKNFGHSGQTNINNLIENESFYSLSKINKDKIKTCKICEFRYLCSDCRVFIEDPNDEYSKPLKCGYDPYTGIWEDWSKNPLKQQAIKYFGL